MLILAFTISFQGDDGQRRRSELAKTIYPRIRDAGFFENGKNALVEQLSAAGMDTTERDADLDTLAPSKAPGSGT